MTAPAALLEEDVCQPAATAVHDQQDDDFEEEEEEDEYAGLGDIPLTLKASTESTDLVRLSVQHQGDYDAYSPNHEDRGLFSPVFDGTEVSYRKSNPPLPAALRLLSQQGDDNSSAVTGPAALRLRE
jgi:hypothetical protein